MSFKPRFLPWDSAQTREKHRRKFKLLREFKALHYVDELTPEQAREHLESIEQFVRNHPELKPQIDAFYTRKYGRDVGFVMEFLEKGDLQLLALRTCTVCGKQAFTEDELDLFVTGLRRKYGKRNLCKECSNEARRIYYQQHRVTELARRKQDRIKYRQRDIMTVRRWHKEHREQQRIYAKNYYEEHKDQIAIRKENYRKLHRNESLAQGQAERNVPLANKCELCESTENLERHHPDYNKPLEVQTLCRSCHRRIHFGDTPRLLETSAHGKKDSTILSYPFSFQRGLGRENPEDVK